MLSLASQVSGLLQLAALLWRHGPSNATDAYFYLFNLGNLPTQILIVGVLYPMLLSQDRVTRKGSERFGLWVPVSALAAVGVGAAWLAAQGRVSEDLVPILGLAALNAVVQARLWYLAVAAEADGVPHWVAAIALPANALATLVVAFPWPSSTATVTAMLAALAAANTAFLVIFVRRRVGRTVIEGLPAAPARAHVAHWWFLTKSFVGYGGLMVVQSLALVLPPSTLTLLTLPMKIVGSVSATFVNAVMPLIVHQNTESPIAARRFLRILGGIIGAVSLFGSAGGIVFFPDYGLHFVAVGLWLVASASASVSQRMMFRFLPPSASRITIVVVPLIVAAVALSIQSEGFGLLALLCAYALVDAASGFLVLLSLGDRLMAIVTGLISLGLVTIWVFSLMHPELA
ncbi:hypothetical protein [Arthrobacter oryzae]|uniref:hypothetical protein n=1 Tax=Arthrobacter oryzae TaxID=409290 RepID=UPI0030C9A8BD